MEDTPVHAGSSTSSSCCTATAGEIVRLSDICIHRVAGWPAARWTATASVPVPTAGSSTSQVAAPRSPPTARACRSPRRPASTPTRCEERYGYAFVFLGDLPECRAPADARPRRVRTGPGRPGQDYRTITGEFQWKANYERVLENGVDVAHAPFVHSTSSAIPTSRRSRTSRWRSLLVGGTDLGTSTPSILDPPQPRASGRSSRRRTAAPPDRDPQRPVLPQRDLAGGQAAARHHDASSRRWCRSTKTPRSRSGRCSALLHQAVAGGAAAGGQRLRRRTTRSSTRTSRPSRGSARSSSRSISPPSCTSRATPFRSPIAAGVWQALNRGGIDQHVVGPTGDYHGAR